MKNGRILLGVTLPEELAKALYANVPKRRAATFAREAIAAALSRQFGVKIDVPEMKPGGAEKADSHARELIKARFLHTMYAAARALLLTVKKAASAYVSAGETVATVSLLLSNATVAQTEIPLVIFPLNKAARERIAKDMLAIAPEKERRARREKITADWNAFLKKLAAEHVAVIASRIDGGKRNPAIFGDTAQIQRRAEKFNAETAGAIERAREAGTDTFAAEFSSTLAALKTPESGAQPTQPKTSKNTNAQ